MTETGEHKSRVLENGHLQVSFHWHRDRFAHTIGLFVDERFAPVLASMEGSGDEPWPCSPPLQALEVETSADGQIAMLVGMAGRSHWSVAVELDNASSTLTFDVACRLKDVPPNGAESDQAASVLRSAYRTMFEPERVACSPDQLSIGNMIVTARPGAAIRIQSEGLSITATSGSSEVPRTVRWRYLVRPKAG